LDALGFDYRRFGDGARYSAITFFRVLLPPGRRSKMDLIFLDNRPASLNIDLVKVRIGPLISRG
jgi:hypothetical protein